MHVTEIYLCYTLIGLAIGWHFSRCKGSGAVLKAGDTFRISTPFLVLAAFSFFGFPAVLVFSLPEAINPLAASIATILVTIFCAVLFAAIVTTRLHLTPTGISLVVLRMSARADFNAFRAVEVRRFNIVCLPEKSTDRPFVIPAAFQHSARIFDHIRSSIEAGKAARVSATHLTSPSA